MISLTNHDSRVRSQWRPYNLHRSNDFGWCFCFCLKASAMSILTSWITTSALLATQLRGMGRIGLQKVLTVVLVNWKKNTSNWTNQGFRNHRWNCQNQTFSLNEPLRSFREYLLQQVSTFHAGVCSMVRRSRESPALSSGASDFAMLCCIVFDQHAGHLYNEGKNIEHFFFKTCISWESNQCLLKTDQRANYTLRQANVTSRKKYWSIKFNSKNIPLGPPSTGNVPAGHFWVHLTINQKMIEPKFW